MKIGITINISNYESVRFDSSERESKRECYEELLEILMDFTGYFARMEYWIKLLTELIKRNE